MNEHHEPRVPHRTHVAEDQLRKEQIADHVMQRDGDGRGNDRNPIEIEDEKRDDDENVKVHCGLTAARGDERR